jgi:rhomboid protease GluP
MNGLSDGIAALERWLVARGGFEPLERLLPPAFVPQLGGLFDVCLGRWDGQELRVCVLLEDGAPDPSWARQRCETLRVQLKAAEGAVRGRIKASAWLVVPTAVRVEELRAGFLGFDDGHFLSKTTVGRGLLCPGAAAYQGRSAASPEGALLASVLADPSLDPGEFEAARVRQESEAAAEFRVRDERAAQRMLRPGPVPATFVLIGLNVVGFALQWIAGAALERKGVSSDVAGSAVLLSLGANDPRLTLGEGQWWRLLASAFLHAGWLHLLMNLYALYLVGSVTERLAGPWRTASAYLATGLIASLVSALLAEPGAYSVGASGAIMGLMGLLLAPRFRRDPRLPEALAGRLFRWLASPVALIFAFGLLLRLADVPLLLDNAAHLGGLLAGFALGYLCPSFLVRPTLRRV